MFFTLPLVYFDECQAAEITYFDVHSVFLLGEMLLLPQLRRVCSPSEPPSQLVQPCSPKLAWFTPNWPGAPKSIRLSFSTPLFVIRVNLLFIWSNLFSLLGYHETGVFPWWHSLTSGFRKSGSSDTETVDRITAWDLNTNTKFTSSCCFVFKVSSIHFRAKQIR